MELWDRCHLLFFFYAFVDIAIRVFAADLSLLIRFSVIEVKLTPDGEQRLQRINTG